MNNLKSMLAIALLAGSGVSAAYANQAPNFYECKGKQVNLTLSVGSKGEVGIMPASTVLNLKVGKKSYEFQEADISTQPSQFGKLWEVTLKHAPDAYIDQATLVIPTVSLADSPLKFKSKLILTHLLTPFTGQPPVGVINPSRYVDIACTASMVYY